MDRHTYALRRIKKIKYDVYVTLAMCPLILMLCDATMTTHRGGVRFSVKLCPL